MSSPPMPLATEEQTATSISRILAEVRRRKYGHHPSSEHWLGFPLNSDQYEEFDCQIRKDDDLWGYYDDKIRYVVWTALIYCSWTNAVADTITSHPTNYMFFAGPNNYTQSSNLILSKSSYDSYTKLPSVLRPTGNFLVDLLISCPRKVNTARTRQTPTFDISRHNIQASSLNCTTRKRRGIFHV
jgi:hypothetical protein